MVLLLHIAKVEDWLKGKAEKVYKPESLNLPNQILEVANKYYPNQQDLVLLYIDSNKVKSKIKYEDLNKEGKQFPHIYGILNTDAVIKVVEFKPEMDGKFTKIVTENFLDKVT